MNLTNAKRNRNYKIFTYRRYPQQKNMLKNGILFVFSGGGVRCLYESAFLTILEQRLSRPFQDYVDVCSGFSGGSVTLLPSLQENPMPLKEQIDVFIKRSSEFPNPKNIFQKYWSLFKELFFPLEPASITQKLFDSLFKPGLLSELKKDVLVWAYNVKQEAVEFLTRKKDVEVKDACMASSAFPIGFKAHHSSIDGNLCANQTVASFLYARRHHPSISRWTVVSVDVSFKKFSPFFKDLWNFLNIQDEHQCSSRIFETFFKDRVDFFLFKASENKSTHGIQSDSFDQAQRMYDLSLEHLSQLEKFDRLIAHLKTVLNENEKLVA